MANLILIFVCFLLGILFRRWSELPQTGYRQITFPADTPRAINAFILYISLPSLILYHLHEVQLAFSVLALVFMPWIVFFFSFVIMNVLARIFRWDRATAGSLILTSGLGNTSFVGLPMIEAFYGKEYLGYGLIADQGGTFFMLSTAGLLVAGYYSPVTQTQKQSFRDILLRIITFPPFFALMLTLMLRPVPYPEWVKEILLKIGSTLPPLAMFSVGYQLKLDDIRDNTKYLATGLFYKLLLAPSLIAFLYSFLDITKEVYHISVFEAAMGPMITGGVVAISYQLRPSLVTLMLATGISASLLTAPVFWYFFH